MVIGEISPREKFLAGTLLIFFSVAAITGILFFWPDRLPEPGEKAYYYAYQPFHMTLIDTTECRLMNLHKHITSVQPTDTTKLNITDSSQPKPVRPKAAANRPITFQTISLNTILLLMVAMVGFLGALIHISSSFTNFVGAEEFKRSWLLWYFVKPFTGAAIALIFYFVFRAGFFNGSENGGSINLYGIIALSALAGLFTDKATLKLEEVFTVIFKPKDDRPDKMQDLQIQDVIPKKLDAAALNHITLKGKLLTKKKVSIKMGTTTISNLAITDDAISFDYTVPDAIKTQPSVPVIVTDDQNKEIFKQELPIH